MSTPTNYSLAIVLDEKRLKLIKGTLLEDRATDMFGGAIRALILEVPFEQGRRILEEFPSAGIDARGFLEEVPVAFKKALFEEVVRLKSTGVEVLDSVFRKISVIKAAAEREQEHLPPPDV